MAFCFAFLSISYGHCIALGVQNSMVRELFINPTRIIDIEIYNLLVLCAFYAVDLHSRYFNGTGDQDMLDYYCTCHAVSDI